MIFVKTRRAASPVRGPEGRTASFSSGCKRSGEPRPMRSALSAWRIITLERRIPPVLFLLDLVEEKFSFEHSSGLSNLG